MVRFSIVIPAYNEAQRLPKTLETLLSYIDTSPDDWEIIVVDDGSTDDTYQVAHRHAASEVVRVIQNPGNRGKGFSVRHGMLEARGEWRLFSDADLSTPIQDIETLLAAAVRQDAAIAIGSRALDRSLVTIRQSAFRESSGRFFNLLVRLLTGLPFQDTQCGFKLYREDAAKQVFSRQLLDGFSFDVEDLVIGAHLRIRTIEVPVRWENAEGTKVSLAAGLQSFADLFRIYWNQLSGRYR